LNDLATGIYGGAYDSERNRMQQAMQMAPGLANQDYVDLGQLSAVGSQREGLAREQAEAPGLALDQYLGRVTGSVGSTSYQPSQRNRAAGAIGGAMLGSQMGEQYGGWGQLGGGLLGGIMGGWG
jgi:membrane carboxypeptidase/penicillin-binding protein